MQFIWTVKSSSNFFFSLEYYCLGVFELRTVGIRWQLFFMPSFDSLKNVSLVHGWRTLKPL